MLIFCRNKPDGTWRALETGTGGQTRTRRGAGGIMELRGPKGFDTVFTMGMRGDGDRPLYGASKEVGFST